MSKEIIGELKGFAEHCISTGQEQVADLQYRAITALESAQNYAPAGEVYASRSPYSPGHPKIKWHDHYTLKVGDKFYVQYPQEVQE